MFEVATANVILSEENLYEANMQIDAEKLTSGYYACKLFSERSAICYSSMHFICIFLFSIFQPSWDTRTYQ